MRPACPFRLPVARRRIHIRDDAAPDGGSTSGGWSLTLTTAAAGGDYVAASGTLTIAAGSTSGGIAVTVNGDPTVEPAETFTVNLSSASGANITDGQGVGTIANDDLVFTDHPLTTGTFIKRVHITELRTAINASRVAKGLAAFSFTDATLTESTPVKALHITELRTAIAQTYAAVGQTPPTYTDPTIVPGTTVVRAEHISEFRTAIANLP